MAEGAAELDPRLERARCGDAAAVQALFEAIADERADVVIGDALRLPN